MATELYLNPDNTVGGLDSGQVMVAPTQEEFEDCCCEGEPCSDCLETEQPNAVATVDGPGKCDAECLEMEGTYVAHASGLASDYCWWTWYHNSSDFLSIEYHPATGKWYAKSYDSVENTYFGDPSTPLHYRDVTGLIKCEAKTGELSGAFVLDGLEAGAGGPDCRGCEMTVTLGG